jgi:hypothetical protein
MDPLTNLKYARVADWVRSHATPVEVVINPPFIKDAASTWLDNYRSLMSLATLPDGFTSFSMRVQYAFDNALFNIAKRVLRTEEDDSPEMQAKILAEGNRLLRMGEQFDRRPPPGMTLLQADALRVDEFVVQGDTAHRAIKALYHNLILGMWTLFESLADDLWVAALNTYPKTLSRVSGDKKRIQRLSTDRRGKPKQVQMQQQPPPEWGATVSLNDIHEITGGSLNLGVHMGDLLRKSYDFDSLDSIRLAYSAAFSKRSADIDQILSDPALDRLSAVRNVIAHGAGRCDQDYEKKQAFLHNLPPLTLGERLELVGDQVVDLISPVSKVSTDLITKVSEWIKISAAV